VWRGGRWHRCRAAVAENPGGHEHIRELLAQKYGWRDCWIGLIADTAAVARPAHRLRGRVSWVWYFAYGSNMQAATFRGRRGIMPRAAVAAKAVGWRLVLDKPPLLSVGHSFANVVPDPGATVYGVAYEISAEDYAHVEFSEGVQIGNYLPSISISRRCRAAHCAPGRSPRTSAARVSSRRSATWRC
jgi:hypothetical protein